MLLALGIGVVVVILIALLGGMGFLGPTSSEDNDNRYGGGSFLDWML